VHFLYLELRYALRAVRKSPGFAAVAIVTLAFGIGATTVIFSAVHGILLEPFPYKNAARLTNIYVHDVTQSNDNGRAGFSMPELMAYREQNHVFDDMMGYGYVDVLYMARGETQLITQLLMESLVLSLLACALGCLFAVVGVKVVVVMMPPYTISPTAVIEMNPLALTFAVLISLLTTLLCGLAPTHVVRGELSTRLVTSVKGCGGGFLRGHLRASLVVLEVAVSIVLLVGAGLMMRTLFALQRVDLGFNPQNVFVSRLPFPKGRYQTGEQKRVFFNQLLDRISGLPGVVAATTTSNLPPYGGIRGEVTVPGMTHADRWEALVQLSSEGFVQTLGLRLMKGRSISRVDVDDRRRVAVINELLARRFFRGEDPIGRSLKFDLFDRVADAPHDAYFEVIGIVADAKNQGLQDGSAESSCSESSLLLTSATCRFLGSKSDRTSRNAPPSTPLLPRGQQSRSGGGGRRR
jgi:hypothetical protein